MRIFNTPYEKIDLNNIHVTKDDETSIKFNDEKNEYIFNKSKSVLLIYKENNKVYFNENFIDYSYVEQKSPW